MQIIPIEMTIDNSDILKSNATDIESSIKEYILVKIIENLSSMLDDENFLEMEPSEDGQSFNVRVDILIGSAIKYLDAISDTTVNLLTLCKSQGISQTAAVNVISKATSPLQNLLKSITEDDKIDEEKCQLQAMRSDLENALTRHNSFPVIYAEEETQEEDTTENPTFTGTITTPETNSITEERRQAMADSFQRIYGISTDINIDNITAIEIPSTQEEDIFEPLMARSI
jgi:type II secretory pathway pseudopilin PulG